VIPEKVGELVSAEAVSWLSLTPWGPSFWERARFWLASRVAPVLGLVALAGLVILARRGEWLVPLYVLGSLVLIVLTPWPGQYLRYLMPLGPVMAVATAVTLSTVVATLRRRPGRLSGRAAWAPAVAIMVVLFAAQANAIRRAYTWGVETSYVGRDGRPVRYRLFWYDRPWQQLDAAIDWVARHAAPGDVVITSTPHWVYLRTGLQSVMPPFEADPARAAQLMASVPRRRYLILDHLDFLDVSGRYGGPVVAAFPQHWRLVFRNEPLGASVYEYVDGAD
jgi:hypothetical protein